MAKSGYRGAGNSGASTLRRRKRAPNTMASYDALPAELRSWLQSAALPWSVQSCQRIWKNTRAKGTSIEGTIERLNDIERAMLARDKISTFTTPRP